MSLAAYKKALEKAVADLATVNCDRERLEQRAKYLEETIAGLRMLIDSTDVMVLNPPPRAEPTTWPAGLTVSPPAAAGMDFREVVVRALGDAPRTIQNPETQAVLAQVRRAARIFFDDYARPARGAS